MVKRLTASALLALGTIGLYAYSDMRHARALAQTADQPKLGDCVHFQLYYPPEMIGQERAGFVAFVHPDSTINLAYFVGAQPMEPDNQPAIVEYKLNRHRGEIGTPSTWHFCSEHEE